jgi:hypothetical protein
VTNGVLWRTSFSQPVVDAPTADYVSVDPRLSLFNKFNLAESSSEPDSVFLVEPASAVHNRLLFVHSGLGNHYYLGDRRKISFFQQEPDLFELSHDFNAIGRYMLLRIENPSAKVYLRIAATRTFITGHTAWSPKALVHGATDIPLNAFGDGAFNLFIGPIAPQPFEGANYLAIDFAEMPRQLKDKRPGLKALYNSKVPLDYRRLIGWARDVSAVSEEEYASMPRPREISNFPDDLALAHGLEFTGAFEDGWLSSHAKFVVAGAKRGEFLRIRALVPELKGTAMGRGAMQVAINGTSVCSLPAPLGTFDWLIPVPSPGAVTSVDLRFTGTALLPKPDERPVGAQLQYLGIVDVGSKLEFNFDGQTGPKLAAPGIDPDGWAAANAQIVVPALSAASDVTLTLEYPDWGGAKAATLDVSADGTPVTKSIALTPGTRPIVRLRLPASSEPRLLTLASTGAFQLPSGDNRQRALRLAAVTITSAPSL